MRRSACTSKATGERPFGWYTGRTSAHTLGLVLADGGFPLFLRFLCTTICLIG